jgi:hypothetical protein
LYQLCGAVRGAQPVARRSHLGWNDGAHNARVGRPRGHAE